MKKSMAIFGCGNMARALVLGMKKVEREKLQIHTFTPSFIRAEALALETNGQAYKEIESIPKSDFYMIACKPQQLEELALSIRNKLPEEACIISILAGTKIKTLKDLLKVERVVRVMPNTPALINEGVHALHFGKSCPQADITYITKLFNTVGKSFIFDKEEEIDIITGFSGSGPAYLFEIARIMSEKMTLMGIDQEIASEMIKRTFYGSSKLLLTNESSAKELRDQVTSKKGVTFEALKSFSDNGLEQVFSDALDAAYKRAIELSN